MMLPDANLLLYAYNTSATQHDRAKRWWEDTLSATETVGLSWQTITAFLRISTNTRAFAAPYSIKEASEIVTTWMQQPVVQIVVPSARHWEILNQLLNTSQTTGPLVMDAHLATLAIEYGATLCTTDADFSRFKGLRVVNPIRA